MAGGLLSFSAGIRGGLSRIPNSFATTKLPLLSGLVACEPKLREQLVSLVYNARGLRVSTFRSY